MTINDNCGAYPLVMNAGRRVSSKRGRDERNIEYSTEAHIAQSRC